MLEVEYGLAHAIQADRRAKALSTAYALGNSAPHSWRNWLKSFFSQVEVAVPNQEWSNAHKVVIGQYR